MKFFVSILCAILVVLPSVAKDNTEVTFDYQIEGVGTGSQGTDLVQVWVMCKKPNITDVQIGRCAVKGILFKGFSSKEFRQQRKPLAGSANVEQQHADFFNEFFKDDGAFSNYVQVISNTRKVVKLEKKQYKVGATVTVLKEQLRKDLEAAGILKNINDGF
ncbi:MAG: hypothetical protein IJY31_04740 [Muribaculaceae bacterium]|nr:hypothetical protein [Muribaculaceae bacterium]